MRTIACLAIAGMLAGCEMVSMKVPEPTVPAATVAVTLPAATEG
jgi:hypothetical protein